jgi:hypothetical protein
MIGTLAMALAWGGEQPMIVPAAIEAIGPQTQRVTGSWLLMNDPAAVEILIRSGRGAAMLPAHFSPALRAAKSAPGLGLPSQAPASESEASDADRLFRGRDVIQPAARINENIAFPTVDAWTGQERLMFHGVSLKGGRVSVRGLVDGGIRAVSLLVQDPEINEAGEVHWTRQTLEDGRGDSAPIKPGQAYAVILEMDAATAGGKRGLIQVDDGSRISLSVSGLVTNPSSRLSAQFMPSENAFMAGKSYDRMLRVAGQAGSEVRIDAPRISGMSIDAPLSVKIPASGRTDVKVTFSPSKSMPDLSSTTASFLISTAGADRLAGLPFSVATSWLVAKDFSQRASEAHIWAGWRINSSGYCIYDTRLWAESPAVAKGLSSGFVLNPTLDSTGAKLGFLSSQAKCESLSPNFCASVFEGSDPRLADQLDRIDGFEIGFFLNSPAASEAWAAKHRLQELRLRGADQAAPDTTSP